MPTEPLPAWNLQPALEQRRAEARYRQRTVLDSPQQPAVMVAGKPMLAFCSNDYLGLAADAEVKQALQEGADRFGVGGGASHLVLGHSYAHEALEAALAEFTGRPRALLFSCGFMANQGTITGLLGKSDAVYEDRLNHASLLDGGLASGARFKRYRHNDAEHLKTLLSRETRRSLVVTDGVFSMDGDCADLKALSRVSRERGAWLMVDDAHGFGCLGENGGGCAEAQQLSLDEVPVLVGTLGKAFGTAGAFVSGSDELVETLIQFARSYIYTTSLPPAIAWATLTSLQKIRQEKWRREHLAALINRFREGAAQLGFELGESQTPIQPVMVGDSARALAFSQRLAAEGIYVAAIRPPTVSEGTARLRITLTATHSEAQVDQLLAAMARAQEADNG